MQYNFIGEYSPSNNYSVKDVVSYKPSTNADVKFYMCLKAHTSSSPQIPNPSQDTEYWGVMNTSSNFPNSVDSFLYHANIQASDRADIERINELTLKSNRTEGEDEELNTLTQKHRNKLVLADDLNKLQDSISNLQMFFKDKVDAKLTENVNTINSVKDAALNSIEQKKNNVIEYLDGTTAGQLRNDIGFMNELETSNKNSLVEAVNEIYDLFSEEYTMKIDPSKTVLYRLDGTLYSTNGKGYYDIDDYEFVEGGKFGNNGLVVKQKRTGLFTLVPYNFIYGQKYSLSVFFKVNQNLESDDLGVIVSISISDAICYEKSTKKLKFGNPNASLVDLDVIIDDYNFHHIAITSDDEEKYTKIYLDGNEIYSDTKFIEIQLPFLSIGNYIYNFFSYFIFNELRMDNYVVTQEEIRKWLFFNRPFIYNTETQLKDISDKIGNLSDLDTTDKSNLVSASNEINSKVGDLQNQIDDFTNRGFGADVVRLDNVNLDEVIETGNYYIDGASTNRPVNQAGYLKVEKAPANGYLCQFFTANSNNTYSRTLVNGTWLTWVQLATESSVSNKIGDLSNLHTNEKGTIVASINELKDSVEEGTWTPTLISQTDSATFYTLNSKYVDREGYYRKIGKTVFVYGTIEVNPDPFGTPENGYLRIEGLPFVAKGTTGNMAIGFMRGIIHTGQICLEVRTDSNILGFTESLPSGTLRNVRDTDLVDNVSYTIRIKFFGSYIID